MKTSSLFRLSAIVIFVAGAVSIVQGAPTLVFEKDYAAIYTASADGRNPKKICDGNHPSISPDGRFIVYTVTTDLPPPKKRKGAADEPTGVTFRRALHVRELATGTDRTLPTAGATQVDAPQWSPNGEWIAFEILQEHWQAAVIKPDGAGLRVLTTGFERKDGDTFVSGWNDQKNEVLAQDLENMAQITPAGEVTWHIPVHQAIGGEVIGSDMRCTISADGKLLVTTHQIQEDEFSNLDGPSAYLAIVPQPEGKAERVTPKKFDAANPWLDPAGEFVLFRGFGQKDVTTIKHSDGVKLKMRIYRYDLKTKQMTPLVEGGDFPSLSQK